MIEVASKAKSIDVDLEYAFEEYDCDLRLGDGGR